MTGGAGVGQAGPDGEVVGDIAGAVTRERALALLPRKFALEELPTAADRAEGIAGDQVERRAGRLSVGAAGTNLLLQRLKNAFVCQVGRLGLVDKLGRAGEKKYKCAR